MHAALLSHLSALGVTVLLRDEVVLDASDQAALSGQSSLVLCPRASGKAVRTREGRTLEADLLFVCAGTRVNAASFEKTFAHALNERKQLIVNDRMQVRDPAYVPSPSPQPSTAPTAVTAPSADVGVIDQPKEEERQEQAVPYLPNVFALGDCCSRDANMAIRARNQGQYLARLLLWQVAQARAGICASSEPRDFPEAGPADEKTGASAVVPLTVCVGDQRAVAWYPPLAKASEAAAQAEEKKQLSPSPQPPQEDGLVAQWESSRAATVDFSFPPPPLAYPPLQLLRTKASTLFAPVWWDAIVRQARGSGAPAKPLDYEHARDYAWEGSGSGQEESAAAQAAEDADALAQSMHVSPLVARQLLMHSTAIMDRSNEVQYT